MQTPRVIKLFILVSALIGQLFVTGFFWDSNDITWFFDTETYNGYVNDAIFVAIISVLLMIPLKIIFALFMTADDLSEKSKREDFEEADRWLFIRRILGHICVMGWLGGCLYVIFENALTFTKEALCKWLVCFFGSFLFDFIIMFNIKLFFKIIFGLILMFMSQSTLMLSWLGLKVCTLVDWTLYLLKGSV